MLSSLKLSQITLITKANPSVISLKSISLPDLDELNLFVLLFIKCFRVDVEVCNLQTLLIRFSTRIF